MLVQNLIMNSSSTLSTSLAHQRTGFQNLPSLPNCSPGYETWNANHDAQTQVLEGVGGGTRPETCLVPSENNGSTHDGEEETEHQNCLSSEAPTQLHHQSSSFGEISPPIEYEAYSAAMQRWILEGTDEEPFNAVGEYLLIDMSQWKRPEDFQSWSLDTDAMSDGHQRGEAAIKQNTDEIDTKQELPTCDMFVVVSSKV